MASLNVLTKICLVNNNLRRRLRSYGKSLPVHLCLLSLFMIEFRSALKVAQVDLATARSHVQQFQEISQANETALATLNATHDEYKMSTEAELTRHQV